MRHTWGCVRVCRALENADLKRRHTAVLARRVDPFRAWSCISAKQSQTYRVDMMPAARIVVHVFKAKPDRRRLRHRREQACQDGDILFQRASGDGQVAQQGARGRSRTTFGRQAEAIRGQERANRSVQADARRAAPKGQAGPRLTYTQQHSGR
jgi:hypothetical protein